MKARVKGIIVFGLAVALVSCADDAPQPGSTSASRQAIKPAGKVGALLKVLLAKAPTVQNAKQAMPKDLVAVKVGNVAGSPQVLVDVLIQADVAAVGKIKALGAEVRTVTKNGIMTATLPLNKVPALAALTEVTRIEAGKRMKMYNDLSNQDPGQGCTACVGMNNDRTNRGAGVVVGVIDSGVDWTHGDFIDNVTGNTRIAFYWDQSDTDDDKTPAGFTYGHEYTAAEIDAGNVKESAEDTDGHGTHVCGTAAGDGSDSGKMGVAPEATIVFVKFDFDGDRNSDAAIIDGVDYIFQKAAALGMPAVINMSLGTDFGPHDGSTLEERGIDALTGPGKIVVVAAGNPGSNNWSQKLSWGFAMHGKGPLGQLSAPEDYSFDFEVSDYASHADKDLDGDGELDADYIFFDIWYPGNNKCRVQVITPCGQAYPPSFGGRYRNTWVTGSPMTGFSTSEGGIIVGNGGDQLDWGADSGDHEIYLEVSDYWGTNPVKGTWKVKLVPADSNSTCSGTYHAWHAGSSSIVRGWRDDSSRVPPRFDGVETDNAYTIGSPASADNVLAVAAYQSRNCWDYVYGTTDSQCVGEVSNQPQCYGDAPIDYYDFFALGELAYFSARGPRRDETLLKPEIATPGVGIASALSSHAIPDDVNKCLSYWDGGEYHYGTNRVLPGEKATVIQGTSMACPNATGAVALMLEANGALDIACLRSLLSQTALHDDITDVGANLPGTAQTDTDLTAGPGAANNDWGYGKMDIDAAVAAAPTFCGAPPPPPPPPPECEDDAGCDDSNVCTVDACVSGTCEHTVDTGIVCRVSTDTCDPAETCAADGSCPADVNNCAPPPECTVDADCVDDGNVCTVETCDNGTCTAPVNTSIVCRVSVNTCDPAETCAADGSCPTDVNECLAKGDPCTSNAECQSGRCHPKKGTCL
jgi:subtilisin family serine protease